MLINNIAYHITYPKNIQEQDLSMVELDVVVLRWLIGNLILNRKQSLYGLIEKLVCIF